MCVKEPLGKLNMHSLHEIPTWFYFSYFNISELRTFVSYMMTTLKSGTISPPSPQKTNI